jgi:hypothetical protein
MEEYVSTRVADTELSAQWLALSEDIQSMYLVNSTRSIDGFSEWIGRKYSRDQGLSWPRYDAVVDGYLVDNITFPARVKEATAEMALWSLQNSGAVSTTNSATYDSIKLGPIVIDYSESAAGSADKYFPDIIAYLLKDLAQLSNPSLPSSKMGKTVRLNRA